VTAEHPFGVAGKVWTEAQDLKSGDEVETATGQLVRVISIGTSAGRQVVFNFEVEDAHTYFVGGFSSWVHNNSVSELAAKGLPRLISGVKSFASKARLEGHFEDHANEWGAGNITLTGYAKRAEALLRSPVKGDIHGFTSSRGWTFRYNMRTNEFATMKPDGTIETIFRPRAGIDYWIEQIRKYGP
jgi:Pretoxin HINT domain